MIGQSVFSKSNKVTTGVCSDNTSGLNRVQKGMSMSSDKGVITHSNVFITGKMCLVIYA